MQRLCASCARCSFAGKITVTSLWPCITDLVVYSPVTQAPDLGSYPTLHQSVAEYPRLGRE